MGPTTYYCTAHGNAVFLCGRVPGIPALLSKTAHKGLVQSVNIFGVSTMMPSSREINCLRSNLVMRFILKVLTVVETLNPYLDIFRYRRLVSGVHN